MRVRSQSSCCNGDRLVTFAPKDDNTVSYKAAGTKPTVSSLIQLFGQQKAPLAMKPPVQCLLMFGVGLAMGASFALVLRETPPEPSPSPHRTTSARWGIDRFFTDVSLADIYTEPWIHETLSKPDSVTLHRATPDGDIVYGNFRFSAAGKPLSAEDRLIVSRLLRSMTAYQVGLGLACAYRPGVLLRVQRDRHTVDYPICFGCQVADWYADGVTPPRSIAPRLGFSDASFPILREIVGEAFPSLNLSLKSTPRPRPNDAMAPDAGAARSAIPSITLARSPVSPRHGDH